MEQIHSNECIFVVPTHPQSYLHKTFSHSTTLSYFYFFKKNVAVHQKYFIINHL